jgi:hypothetical protein
MTANFKNEAKSFPVVDSLCKARQVTNYHALEKEGVDGRTCPVMLKLTE